MFHRLIPMRSALQYARARPPGRSLGGAPVEDQLHLIRPPDVEALANHLFDEDAATERSIQDLGQRELRLKRGRIAARAGVLDQWR
jgi:hypothetical protein